MYKKVFNTVILFILVGCTTEFTLDESQKENSITTLSAHTPSFYINGPKEFIINFPNGINKYGKILIETSVGTYDIISSLEIGLWTLENNKDIQVSIVDVPTFNSIQSVVVRGFSDKENKIYPEKKFIISNYIGKFYVKYLPDEGVFKIYTLNPYLTRNTNIIPYQINSCIPSDWEMVYAINGETNKETVSYSYSKEGFVFKTEKNLTNKCIYVINLYGGLINSTNIKIYAPLSMYGLDILNTLLKNLSVSTSLFFEVKNLVKIKAKEYSVKVILSSGKEKYYNFYLLDNLVNMNYITNIVPMNREGVFNHVLIYTPIILGAEIKPWFRIRLTNNVIITNVYATNVFGNYLGDDVMDIISLDKTEFLLDYGVNLFVDNMEYTFQYVSPKYSVKRTNVFGKEVAYRRTIILNGGKTFSDYSGQLFTNILYKEGRDFIEFYLVPKLILITNKTAISTSINAIYNKTASVVVTESTNYCFFTYFFPQTILSNVYYLNIFYDQNGALKNLTYYSNIEPAYYVEVLH